MLLVGPKRRYCKQQPEQGLHCGCPGLCFCTPKDEWNLYRIYKHQPMDGSFREDQLYHGGLASTMSALSTSG